MSQCWIEFHAPTIIKLKKFGELKRAFNWNIHETLGFLGLFWGEALVVAEAGDITGWTPEYLCELTRIGVNPKKLWETLVSTGWIDEKEGGKVVIHDWIEYVGRYLIKKLATSERGKKRLTEIWALHGLTYGQDPTEIEKRHIRDRRETPPNQPDQTASSANAEDSPKPLLDSFFKRLREKLKEEPVGFPGGHAAKFFKSALKKDFSVEEIERRMGFWFDSTDPFIVKARWRFSLFTSYFPTLRDGAVVDPKDAKLAALSNLDANVRVLIRVYKIAQGFKANDVEWDRMQLRSSVQPASMVLRHLGDSLETASACIERILARAKREKFAWGWAAVIREATDFKRDRQLKRERGELPPESAAPAQEAVA